MGICRTGLNSIKERLLSIAYRRRRKKQRRAGSQHVISDIESLEIEYGRSCFGYGVVIFRSLLAGRVRSRWLPSLRSAKKF